MHVLLTGGTGFVGSQTVRPLLDAGHRVRLLVRSEVGAVEALRVRGVDPAEVELHLGDMTHADAVARAVDGCDATIHAAAAIGVTGRGASVHEVNTVGARTVVGAAVDAGHDQVVHVSSVAVFIPPAGPVIDASSPLASPRTDYGRSKVDTEHELRARQDRGEPITIVYPGGVIGRDQRHLDATMEGLVAARTQGWPVTSGGIALLDARDLAAALVACLEGERIAPPGPDRPRPPSEPDRASNTPALESQSAQGQEPSDPRRFLAPGVGPRRLLLGGHFRTWADLGTLIDEITGHRARRAPLPKPVIVAVGTLLDQVRRVRPLGYPLTRDAAEIMTTMVPTDDRPTLEALGIRLRPLEESLVETVTWLAEAGHLPARNAGRLASPPRD